MADEEQNKPRDAKGLITDLLNAYKHAESFHDYESEFDAVLQRMTAPPAVTLPDYIRPFTPDEIREGVGRVQHYARQQQMLEHVWSSTAVACLIRTLDEAQKKIAALENDVYAPGMWKCSQCSFILTKFSIVADTGDVGISQAPRIELCPNDQTLMRRVPWREEAETNLKAALEARKDHAEAEQKVQNTLSRIDDISLREQFKQLVQDRNQQLDGVTDFNRIDEINCKFIAKLSALLNAPEGQAKRIQLRTFCDAQANGRSGTHGDRRWSPRFLLEDGTTLVVQMGKPGRDSFKAMLEQEEIDDLAESNPTGN